MLSTVASDRPRAGHTHLVPYLPQNLGHPAGTFCPYGEEAKEKRWGQCGRSGVKDKSLQAPRRAASRLYCCPGALA